MIFVQTQMIRVCTSSSVWTGVSIVRNAEDGAAAAGHGGIEGAAVVKVLLDGRKRGVEGEDRFFKIILHPCFTPL